MMSISKKLIMALAALIATPALALAAAAGSVALDSSIKLDKVITEGGQTRHELVAPQKVVPGNHLLFVTDYHNTGAKVVDHFVVTNPVPSAVALEEAPAGDALVSVDGGKSWGKLALLHVALPGGGSRAAQAEDVTHVRWVVPVIAPGASGTLSYRAIVR